MTQQRIDVAISTTGQPHRMAFLETCVRSWFAALAGRGTVTVTVDGSRADAERVVDVLQYQDPAPMVAWLGSDTRLGVAANKNTGLELLTAAGAEHMFLSDDDAWPTCQGAIDLHVYYCAPIHSMVNWGPHRLDPKKEWTWPRGSVLYVHRSVLKQVGGMIEAFGTGGHEHVEWSRRIHQEGLTPVLYPAPLVYAGLDNGYGAQRFWHCEDMPKPGEHMSMTMARRRRITSMNRLPNAEEKSEQIMNAMDGCPRFVSYLAMFNKRKQAIVVLDLVSAQT